jgi:S1-C subfamily serine protease
MSRQLAVAVLLLCLTTEARAGPPWQERPAAHSTDENRAASQRCTLGSIADYVRTLGRPVTIPEIGASMRDGRAKLIDGHEVSGVEVIDVAAESPVASVGIRSAGMAAKPLLGPIISLLQAVDHSFMFDNSDVIFAVDGERVRSTLDLANRVEGLARGDRIYLTIVRRRRRVQLCIVTASP